MTSGYHTGRAASTSKALAAGWTRHHEAGAHWLRTRVAVRYDVYGRYTDDGKQYTAHEPLTDEVLDRHCRGEIVIGLHSTSPDGRCLCASWDIDAHDGDDQADPERNWRCALAVVPILAGFKLKALVFDSNGRGGFWVRAFFKKPVAVAVVWWLCGVVAARLKAEGFPPVESFPKQGELTLDCPYGNWIRGPWGRHHKRDHWLRVFDPEIGEWLSGEPAARRLIRVAGDDPKALLEAHEAAQTAAPGANGATGRNGTARRREHQDRPPEAKVRDALAYIPNHDDHYDTWLGVGMALNDWDPSAGLPLWLEYSSRSHKHDEATCRAKWDSFHPGGGLTIASIFARAKEHGWKPAAERTRDGRPSPSVNGSGPASSPPRPTGEPRRPFALTDLGNAERMIHRHGRDVRHIHPWKKWLVWDGKRWATDETAAVERMAKETVRSIYTEAAGTVDDRERAEIVKWARSSENRARIDAMIGLAASESLVPVRPEALDPDPWLLNCLNGVLDLRSGILGKHLREELITKVCPVEFDPSARCPLWESTLELVFDGNADLIRYWQMLCGYCLTGLVTEQVLPICYGTGENGKSTVLNGLMGMLGGDYAMKAPHHFLMMKRHEAHPTELADLAGKRLIVAIEVAEGCRVNEVLVKELTGSDPIRARRMHENFWQFDPTHKVMLCTNHKPVIKGTDHAIWRRIHLTPFEVKIPADKKDRGMPAKLAAEHSGILAWCVRGCLAWRQSGGLEPPEKVSEATKKYREDEDILERFIAECCKVIPGVETVKVKASVLYGAYRVWAERAGENPISLRSFGDRMTEKGFKKYVSNGVWYPGVGLLPDGDERSYT